MTGSKPHSTSAIIVTTTDQWCLLPLCRSAPAFCGRRFLLQRVSMAHIGDLKPDSRNARRPRPRVNDGPTADGNATIDAAASAGLEDVLIVESDGSKVIAVKRTDVAPGSPEFHALAVADNRAAELAEWKPLVLEELSGEIDLSAFFFDEELANVLQQVPDVTFPEYDESTADDVQYCECPSCGHRFPK